MHAAMPLILCAFSTGCRHKQHIAPPPAAVSPPVQVPLAPAPEPSTPPQVATVPAVPNPLPSKPVPKIKKPKRKVDPTPASSPSASAPVLVASGPTPASPSVIGALTAGGDAAPAEKQKAYDAIVTAEKRLAQVPAAKLAAQREAVVRVKTFLKQAHQALDTGDALGASTLATKAKLLLDDLSM